MCKIVLKSTKIVLNMNTYYRGLPMNLSILRPLLASGGGSLLLRVCPEDCVVRTNGRHCDVKVGVRANPSVANVLDSFRLVPTFLLENLYENE